jgi:hypothetical protein
MGLPVDIRGPGQLPTFAQPRAIHAIIHRIRIGHPLLLALLPVLDQSLTDR